MAIVKRGDVTTISRTFPDLQGAYREKAKKALDAALKFGIGQALKGLGELDPIRRRENSAYLAFALKHQFQQWAPQLHEAGEETIDRVADRFAEGTADARDLFAFCLAFGLHPVASGARLIDTKVTYAHATTYYTFRGGLYECYQGNLYTDLRKRREFVVYLPNPPQKLPHSGFSFTIRQHERRS
ncbi:hypothetical protein [Bosea sp. 124]|uniref:hypothetical protein n=1 Tax=Bosea sp. 124 TaxID=2135642 RepID=UPI000D4ABA84|nr:hypothetical protein [Bosea sp. 124]PTM43259.1 hypothetical protein C8D03_4872 [Bosea sp. 124]